MKQNGLVTGGNQDKQVDEVLDFCRSQRGNVIRVGIIDGFPWAIETNGAIINFKTVVQFKSQNMTSFVRYF